MGDKDDKKKKKKKKLEDAVIMEAGVLGNNGADETETDDSPSDIHPAAPKSGSDGALVPDYIFPDTVRKKGRRKGIIIAVVIVIVIIAVIGLLRFLRINRTAASDNAYATYSVGRGDIMVTLSGSGTLQPADSYTVTSLISGDILSALFEEGDSVVRDQALYTVDSSDVGTSIQQAENNLSDAQYKYSSTLKQLDNLKLKAGGTGIITALNVKPGDMVQAGQTVAVIQNSNVMRLTVLFQRAAAESFYPGESAEVTLNSSLQTYPGTVAEVGRIDQILPGNVIAREVYIDVENPGAIAAGNEAFAQVAGIAGLQNGTFDYSYQGSVVATTSANVLKISVSEGDRVTKNQIIVTLQSDTLDQQVQSAKSAVESAQLSLDSQKDRLDDYTITSPISGTIVEKVIKEGDTLKAGVTLCTIYDLSHLTLTLNVDELDIKKVQPGQPVTVTAAAAQGEEYTGRVTKVNIKGTTKNGVTSYPVTIEIDVTEGLLPGMNVDAKITVNDLKDVLTVPVGAVQRGSFVLLKTNDENTATEPGIPAGYVYTEVVLGPSNDTDIVIVSGLEAGDVVAVLDNTPQSYDYNMFERPRQTINGGSSSGTSSQSPSDAAGVS